MLLCAMQGKRGVWLKILQEQADLVPIAIQVTIQFNSNGQSVIINDTITFLIIVYFHLTINY